jgi:hypothetical protein
MEACPVVGLHHLSPEDAISPHPAVVGPLWTWEAMFRPPQWVSIPVEQQVLLLHPEPWPLLTALRHHLFTLVTVVSGSRFPIGMVGRTEDESILPLEEGVMEVCDWLQQQVTVAAMCLPSGGTIVVPQWVSVDRRRGIGQSTSLASKHLPGAVNPDIGGLEVEVSKSEGVYSIDP